jgi:hypothetical protein
MPDWGIMRKAFLFEDLGVNGLGWLNSKQVVFKEFLTDFQYFRDFIFIKFLLRWLSPCCLIPVAQFRHLFK